MADDLDHDEQRREGQHRTEELLEVGETVRLEPAIVVVEERGDREREGGVRVLGRRLEEEEQAAQVGDEDEDRQAADERQVAARRTVADDVLQQVADALDQELHHLLDLARLLLLQGEAQRDEDRSDHQHHEERHGHVVRHLVGEVRRHVEEPAQDLPAGETGAVGESLPEGVRGSVEEVLPHPVHRSVDDGVDVVLGAFRRVGRLGRLRSHHVEFLFLFFLGARTRSARVLR
jgi:hypothetical protein